MVDSIPAGMRPAAIRPTGPASGRTLKTRVAACRRNRRRRAGRS